MNFRSRKLRTLLSLVVLSVIVWASRAYNRYREARDFFTDPNDLTWASQYLDKKIDFCDSTWKETVVLKSGEEGELISPSGRFKIKPNGENNEGADLSLIDTQTSRRFKVESTYLNSGEFKWTKDEHFLIFATSITKDDWFPAEIFISDTSTGRTMYLGDSKFYECELRHWSGGH